MVLKKAESTKEQRRGREGSGWGGTELTNRTSCFLLRVSLSSDQSGSLPSSSPAHQPGAERQLGDSLGHRPAGCALGQHVISGPDGKPSTDVSKGTDGEYPAWASAQMAWEEYKDRQVGAGRLKRVRIREVGEGEHPGTGGKR